MGRVLWSKVGCGLIWQGLANGRKTKSPSLLSLDGIEVVYADVWCGGVWWCGV